MTEKKYQNKNVFVLPSYVGFPQLLRSFIINAENNLFLTKNKSLSKLLLKLGCEVLPIPSIPADMSRKSIQKFNLEALAFSKSFANCSIYFFFYLSDIAALHIIRCLAKNNHPIYYNCDPIIPKVNIFDFSFNKEQKKTLK